MIRLLQFGASLAILILFVSCTPFRSIEKAGKIYKDINFYYVNDSLRFSYMFPADYTYLDGAKKKRSLVQAKLPFPSKHCIASLSTKDPDLNHFVYYFTGNVEDSIIIDTTHHYLYKVIPLTDSSYVILAGSSKEKYFSNLKREYLEFIFENTKKGQDYKNIRFTDPFSLASSCFLQQDSLVNYLLPVLNLERYKENYVNPQEQNIFLQAILSYFAMISNGSELQDRYFSQWLKTKPQSILHRSVLDNKNALSYLIKQCKKERVVMCNENHFDPQGRLWIRLLLEPLYQNGFRYLALEALWEADSLLQKRGFPVYGSGFYTQEPFMAELIRDALRIGYTVVGYDDFSLEREKKQAENIISKTIAQDTSGKILILAGFEHISKNTKGRKRMALFFDSISGISSFCIDQTQCKTEKGVGVNIIDSFSSPMQDIKANIYIENHLSYFDFAKEKGYKSYEIELSKDLHKKIKKRYASNTYIISIYVKSEREADATAVPVYNYALQEKKLPKKIEILLDPSRQYVWVLRNVRGITVKEDNILYF